MELEIVPHCWVEQTVHIDLSCFSQHIEPNATRHGRPLATHNPQTAPALIMQPGQMWRLSMNACRTSSAVVSPEKMPASSKWASGATGPW